MTSVFIDVIFLFIGGSKMKEGTDEMLENEKLNELENKNKPIKCHVR